MKIFSFVLLFIVMFTECLFSQTVQEEYIKRYSSIAVSEMNRTGVPASITLAQGILESGSGTSDLSLKGNNHFGIKCHSTWTGDKIFLDDDEKGECFRVYRTPEESFYDHSEFLKKSSRYKSLFDLSKTDYKSWAKGLKTAGYATNPTYATLLIDIIEKYELSKFDSGIMPVESAVKNDVIADAKPSQKPQSKPSRYYSSNGFELSVDEFTEGSVNNTQYVIPKYNTDVKTLAMKLGMAPWQISKYNDLPKNAKIKAGEIVYLKPKRNKADKKLSDHVVLDGESMRDISQKYAVKISSLYKINGWEDGVEPVAGSKIKLR